MRRERMCITWGRTGRQFIVVMVVVAFCFIVPLVNNAFESKDSPTETLDNGAISDEQLQILRAFDPPLAKAAPSTENTPEKTMESVKDYISGAKTRSDALRNHLNQICNTFNVSLPLTSFMLAHMHFDHKHKAIYCFTPKVACTSWKRIWMKLTGLVKPDKDLSELSRFAIHTSIPNLASIRTNVPDMLVTYKKFMFVRHPFDRVLSAYKDKLEHEDKESSYNFHKEIGAKIQRRYRQPGRNYTGDDVTFSEYIRFISEPGQGTVEQRNEHWLSVHDICNPCRVKYDFIGKYENLKEDAHYVLDWIGASDLIKEFPVSDRPFHAMRYDPKYFGQLDHKTKLSFFQKYLIDFTAFNYTFA